MPDRRKGIAYAVIAAGSFGASAPGVEHFGRGVGPFATACLVYVGALVLSFLPSRDGELARKSDWPRIVFSATLGAVIAPAALAWGLQRSGATSGALMLDLEAVFTVILAWGLYREHVSKRLLGALALIVAGGALLPFRSGAIDLHGGAGLLAVALATFVWAADSNVQRPLAQRNAASIVLRKSAAGALIAAGISFALREPWPDLKNASALIACGVVGYGVCLRAYLLAQKEIGAARTGSVFGFAPLLGAAIAFGLGDREGVVVVLGASVLLAAGVIVLATETPKPEAV